MFDALASYSSYDLFIITICLGFAAFAKGVTGIGFSVVAVSLLSTAIGLKQALPLVIIPSITSNLIVMVGAGHFRETICRFKWIYVTAPFGIFTGLYLLNLIEGTKAAGVLGFILLTYVAFAFSKPNLILPPQFEKPLAIPVGFLTGAINGITGIQIIPLVPYFLSLRLTPNRVVQASNCSFTLSSLFFLSGLFYVGLADGAVLWLAPPSICITLLGVKLGERVRAKMSPQHFRSGLLVLLGFLGGTLLSQNIF